MQRIGKHILTVITLLLGAVCSFAQQNYFGLFPGDSGSDSISEMRAKNRIDNNIVWSCADLTTLDQSITFRTSEYRLSKRDQSIMELSSFTPIVIKSKAGIQTLKPRVMERVSLKSMGFKSLDQAKKSKITVTFAKSGAPDTMYVGITPPDRRPKFTAPSITNLTSNSRFVCRGKCYNFKASVPKGYPESEYIFDWYIDGEKMTGRHDCWFQTYSRTNWDDGEHRIEVTVKLKDNKSLPSPKGIYALTQISAEECREKGITVYPYWGTDCADENSIPDYRYSEICEWGSFTLKPIEDIAHFYMEVVNRKISERTITNDPNLKDFQIIYRSVADSVDFKFFDLPLNIKVESTEPYEEHTIYFRFQNDTVNFSTVPYINPSVQLSPKQSEICENAFDEGSVRLMATASGFLPNSALYHWLYSKTREGDYKEVEAPQFRNFIPEKAGFYKVHVTDGVFSCESEPVEVLSKNSGCQKVEIILNGNPWACDGGYTEISSSLKGNQYTYQWLVGPENLDIDNLVSHLQPIAGATSETFNAPPSKDGEAYYLAVTKDEKEVVSKPLAIRKLSPLTGNEIVVVKTAPERVCEGNQVNITASVIRNGEPVDGVFDFKFSKKGDFDFDYKEMNSVQAQKTRSTVSEVLTAATQYKAEVVGCNGKEVSEQTARAEVRSDASCSGGDLYVKASGNDEENDGRSWATAFKTIDKALRAARNMRNSAKFRNTPLSIHLAEGEYTPNDKNGFDFPDNITLYGGYSISPVDGTVSGTKRNPRTPQYNEGNTTILKNDDPNGYIVKLKNKKDVKFVGICFWGSSIITESKLNGRALDIEDSSVEIDSCIIMSFAFAQTSDKPLTAIAVEEGLPSGRSKLTIRNSIFTTIRGGQIGACLSIMKDADVDIHNTLFTNNTSLYFGAVALLTYNSSPKVNIFNSTFYDNQSTQALGYYGRALLRTLGGNPEINIYSSTLCGRFYKESGSINIYHSLVECAGRCNKYEHNYPAKTTFVDNDKRDAKEDNSKAFLANFKGTVVSKLTYRGSFTQVLIPSNRLEIIGQAGAPHPLTPYDARGIQRSPIQSTYGACDADYSVVIEITEQGCPDHKNTTASFKSTIAGLQKVQYQWVDNYNDITNEINPTMKNAKIGTYWLDVKGIDLLGNEITASSNEVRVSDVCEEPGVFYVKTEDKGGNDEFAGTTWDQAFASPEKAFEAAIKYQKKAGSDSKVTIHVAGGGYKLKSDMGITLAGLKNTTVYGGYPGSPNKGSKRAHKRTAKDPGFNTYFTPHSSKGKIMDIYPENTGLRFVTMHLLGNQDRTVNGVTVNGGEVRFDSCLISGFKAGKDADASAFAVKKSADLTFNSCYIYFNHSQTGAFLSISEKGNKSRITMNGCNASSNKSMKYGGSVIYSSAEPTINISNCSFYNNECAVNELAAATTFRISGGKANVNISHSTLCGAYYFESGNVKINNSLVEAVGNASVDQSFVMSPNNLPGISAEVPKAVHEEFKTYFETEKLGKSNTPYLPLVKPIDKVPAMKDKNLEKDQTGVSRGEGMVTPGAIETQPAPEAAAPGEDTIIP